MIYTDEKAGEKIKSSAQGLISLATYGVGMFLGSVLSGVVTEKYSHQQGTETIISWPAVWNIPAGIAAVVLLLLILFFRPEKKAHLS